MQITTIVLAGGRGTRIAHLTGERPKPLVEVRGRPFLDWLTHYLMRAGLRDFVFSAGFKAEQIESWCAGFEAGAQSRGEISVNVVREDMPLGTGGAVLACLDHCDDWLLALNGDSLALFDLDRLLSIAGKPNMDGAVVGLPIDDASRYGSLDVDADGYLRGFHEKRAGSGIINAGFYLLRKSLLLPHRRDGQMSMETEFLPALLQAGARLRVVDAGAAPFIDIGTPETLLAADRFIARHEALFAMPEVQTLP
ncbi:MAG: NTP transferase domain-containing protein [Beijerinckiaceae bacterium]|nr:NTP transferase domain-containing protein [Beijerinckiaceae bacterium]